MTMRLRGRAGSDVIQVHLQRADLSSSLEIQSEAWWSIPELCFGRLNQIFSDIHLCFRQILEANVR